MRRKHIFFSRKNAESGSQNFPSDGEENICDLRLSPRDVVINPAPTSAQIKLKRLKIKSENRERALRGDDTGL